MEESERLASLNKIAEDLNRRRPPKSKPSKKEEEEQWDRALDLVFQFGFGAVMAIAKIARETHAGEKPTEPPSSEV